MVYPIPLYGQRDYWCLGNSRDTCAARPRSSKAHALTGSECDLGVHRDSIEPRALVDERTSRPVLLVDDAVQIVEHESDITVDVPVQPGRIDGLLAAGHAVHETQPIVEIDDAVAPGDFPGAPAAFCPRERVVRNYAGVGTGARS